MKKHIRDAWTKALRSDEYTQTTGKLKTNKGHCCLGVLCEVLINIGEQFDKFHLVFEEHANTHKWIARTVSDNLYYSDGSHQVLPDPLAHALGLNGIENELTRMNDGSFDCEQKSFEEIADYIEENIPCHTTSASLQEPGSKA